MHANLAIRAIKQPLTWFVIVAMLMLSLLALESAGSKHAPSVVPLTHLLNNAKVTQTKTANPPHCTNGKGKDVTANKHCLSNQ